MKNTCVNYDGSYREICGYAETPDPEFPGELEVNEVASFTLLGMVFTLKYIPKNRVCH